MHFKGPLWTFFPELKNETPAPLAGMIWLEGFEAFSARLITESFLKTRTEKIRPKVKLGGEVTVNWLQEEFLNASFFEDLPSYIILHPEQMSAPVKKYLQDQDLDLSSRALIFQYAQSDLVFQKKISEKLSHGIVIESPKFWETEKLLQSILNLYQVKMDYSAKEYLIENSQAEFSEWVNLVRHLRLHFPDISTFSKKHLDDVLECGHLDVFGLAQHLNTKSITKLLAEIVSLNLSFEELRGVWSFLLSHLDKISRPDFATEKKKLSKYDKDILAAQARWNQEELFYYLTLFQRWETACKMKDSCVYAETLYESTTHSSRLSPWPA
jgi:hypothetical protein